MTKQETDNVATDKKTMSWTLSAVIVIFAIGFGYTVGRDLAIKHNKEDKLYEQEIVN